MNYIFTIKKWKGDSTPFPIEVLLEQYWRFGGHTTFAYCLPGYMSTTSDTIDHFFQKFLWKGSSFFQNGMNGYRNTSDTGVKIGQLYNERSKGGYPSLFYRIFGKDVDHSKTIFFLEKAPNIEEKDDASMIINKLRNIKVNALLIGSSNQSQSTYYADVADKGEADVLIVSWESDKDERAKQMNQAINEAWFGRGQRVARCILSKELEDNRFPARDIDAFWKEYLSQIESQLSLEGDLGSGKYSQRISRCPKSFPALSEDNFKNLILEQTGNVFYRFVNSLKVKSGNPKRAFDALRRDDARVIDVAFSDGKGFQNGDIVLDFIQIFSNYYVLVYAALISNIEVSPLKIEKKELLDFRPFYLGLVIRERSKKRNLSLQNASKSHGRIGFIDFRGLINDLSQPMVAIKLLVAISLP